MAICHMWIGVVAIGGVWMGATGAAEIAMVYNCEMRAQNQVEAPFGQRTSVGGFEKVSIDYAMPDTVIAVFLEVASEFGSG